MFCSRYFDARYFAPRYFPKIGATSSFLTFVFDLNTRWFVYLKSLYGGNDLQTMVARYVGTKTGEMTARLQQLTTDANTAMGF